MSPTGKGDGADVEGALLVVAISLGVLALLGFLGWCIYHRMKNRTVKTTGTVTSTPDISSVNSPWPSTQFHRVIREKQSERTAGLQYSLPLAIPGINSTSGRILAPTDLTLSHLKQNSKFDDVLNSNLHLKSQGDEDFQKKLVMERVCTVEPGGDLQMPPSELENTTRTSNQFQQQ